MIDASIDPDFAALERQDSLKETVSPVLGRESSDGAVTKIYHGRLAARAARETVNTEEVATVSVPQPADAVASDPLGHLQAARVGFLAVVVLVFYWLWLRKRRQAR